jgi:hypothetical protein
VKSIAGRHLAALAVAVAVIACGEVPTLEGGIAYISPVQLPAPAVAAGDTLRDSLGRVTPLTIIAYDRNDAPITGVNATFLVSTIPAGVTIDANNRVIAFDSIRTVAIVGRVGDRLQTQSIPLEVVPQPDSLELGTPADSLRTAATSTIQVKVSGLRGGTRVLVKGIIVKWRITNMYPARPVDSTVVFFGNGRTVTTDTTTSGSGVSNRTIGITTAAGLDSVAVSATANNLRGQPLKGSPRRIVIPVKKGT